MNRAHFAKLIRAMAVAICGMATVTNAGNAQERVGVARESLSFVDRRLDSFSPRSGPPGTVVTLRATDMPPLAPFRIGVGALRFGFEEAGWVLADDDGAFTTDITIPAWARNDVVHLFIVFDPYFAPVALSDIFHVTDAEGNVRRQGRITREGDGCVILRGNDSVPYALAGNLGSFKPGDDVVVEGSIGSSTRCPVATTIQVKTIARGESR